MNRIRAVAVMIGSVAAALVITAGTAGAHAVLETSSPANGATLSEVPDLVELVFSENIGEPAALEVIGPDGASVTGGEVEVAGDTLRRTFDPSASPAGAYTISYQIMSADGHVIAGSLAFTVGGDGATGAPAAGPPVSTSDPTDADPAVVIALAAVLAAALLIALGTIRRAFGGPLTDVTLDDVTAAR